MTALYDEMTRNMEAPEKAILANAYDIAEQIESLMGDRDDLELQDLLARAFLAGGQWSNERTDEFIADAFGMKP